MPPEYGTSSHGDAEKGIPPPEFPISPPPHTEAHPNESSGLAKLFESVQKIGEVVKSLEHTATHVPDADTMKTPGEYSWTADWDDEDIPLPEPLPEPLDTDLVPIEAPAIEQEDIIILETVFEQTAAATTAAVQAITHAETMVEQDPEAHAKLVTLAQETRAITEATLRKVSEQLGSNRGGWYEDSETKERVYVKLYENPDQARVEFIANAIYEKIGIRAVRSELFEMDGQLAIASREIPDATATTGEEQRASADVREGFIADAYLANWDVVGLVHDNVVRGGDGHHYRIDNGGALVFRAQGGPKPFAADAVPELESMVNPAYPAGRVFEGLTTGELTEQAKRLIRTLTPEDIEAIIVQSGLQEPHAAAIRDGLIGRRRVLMERFGVAEKTAQHDPKQRMAIAAEKLDEQWERLRAVELRPRVGLLADGGKVENQQIDIIEHPERYDVTFKLTAAQYETLLREIQNHGTGWKPASVDFGEKDSAYCFSDGWEFTLANMRVLVAKGSREHFTRVGSAIGLIRMEIPRTGGRSIADLGQDIHATLTNLLGIEGGLLPPPPEAERAYKWQRYAWQHKLDPTGDRPPDWETIEQRLERREVCPGYFTFVEQNRHRAYADISRYAVYHDLRDVNSICNIIRAGGLLSTHERYRRGLLLDGLSSGRDLETGGADSVFTRTVTEAGIAHSMVLGFDSYSAIVFDASLFDRTDWYAYEDDRYGTTDPTEFTPHRQSPEQLLTKQRDAGFRATNEQMFRTGIGVESMRAIACRSSGWQEKTRDAFAAGGIAEIGGVSVEALLHRGAEVTRSALTDAGIDRVGGTDPVAFTESLSRRNVQKQIEPLLTEADWTSIVHVRPFPNRKDFFALDEETIVDVLRDAGLERLGVRTVEHCYNNAPCMLHDALENMGIGEMTTPEGTSCDTEVFVHGQPREVVLNELRRRGVHTVGGVTLTDAFARARSNTLSELTDAARQPGRSVYDYPQLRDIDDPRALAVAMRGAGFDRIGGTSLLDTIRNDTRDQVLASLRDAGITEVNGKPIEDFVVYASTMRDLINISQQALETPPPLEIAA